MINLVNELLFTKEKKQSIDLLKQFLKIMIIDIWSEKHFNKNLVMSTEDEERS